MVSIAKKLFAGFLPVLMMTTLCWGHACDDPWRPDPSSAGSPTGGGSGSVIAPPPPPPAPGEIPDQTGPNAPSSLGAAAMNAALSNQLPSNAAQPGGDSQLVSPDNIVLIPETSQLKIVGKKGEFRTYIVNRSPRDLFAVKLEAISSAFETTVEPAMIRRLVSGEKDYFTVKLKLTKQLKSGKFPMDFKVSSRGTLIYEGSLGSGGKKEEQPKSNLGIRVKDGPVKIGSQGTFKLAVKNNIYNELNNVQASGSSKYFEITAEPSSVAKLAPGKEAVFTVSLKRKNGVKPGTYDIRMHATTNSRNVADSQIISITTGK